MRYTFATDDCMVITIPLGNVKTTQHGDLMPEKFSCVFKDVYKVFLKGRPKALGVAQLTAAVFVLCLGGMLIHKSSPDTTQLNDAFYTIPSAVFIVCGILTYAAGLSPVMYVMKMSFIFNIIGLFWAITTFALFSIKVSSTNSMIVGLRSVITVLHVLELVLAAILIFWESKAVCRAHFNTLPMITLKQDA
ncbi:hypothetical protein P4O66_004921 [Electrophorus voltai]|uniref:Uncharacterized protein n=1 Tax=Electrophorus voltai TaxID=2609070 RepID=A0AAD9E948_9TELE|nr:hypothetical protein P4O66_004921 [Electrophorus voltai]